MLKQAAAPECRLMKEQHWRATMGTTHDVHWMTQQPTAAGLHCHNANRTVAVVIVAELLTSMAGTVSLKPCLLLLLSVSVQAHRYIVFAGGSKHRAKCVLYTNVKKIVKVLNKQFHDSQLNSEEIANTELFSIQSSSLK